MISQIISKLYALTVLTLFSGYIQAQIVWEQVQLQDNSIISKVDHQIYLSQNQLIITSSTQAYFAKDNYEFRKIIHDSARFNRRANLWTTVVKPNRAIYTAGYINPKVSFIQSLDTFKTWAPYYALNQNSDTLFLNTSDSLKHPLVIHFFDSFHGLIFADSFNNSMLYYTTDNGGNSWIRQEGENLNIRPTDVFNRSSNWSFGLCAFDTTSGYFVKTSSKQIYRVTEKGKVFRTIRFTDTSVSMIRLLMLDTNTGFAIVRYNNIMSKFAKTLDGGLTWDTSITQIPFFNLFGWAPPTANKEGFFYINSLNTMTFYISKDTFRTFAYQFPWVQGEGLSYINFLNSEVGFASSELGKIYKWNNQLPTSINSQSESPQRIVLYPNPCKNILYIPDYALNLQVKDVSGKTFRIDHNLGSLDVSNMINGIYFIQFTDTKGNLYHSKFIVNK
jgi:hypothetical protein